MYRIIVLTDNREIGSFMVRWVRQFYEEQGCFPEIWLHEDTEDFWRGLKDKNPCGAIVSLPGVAGLNASEHLRSLLPGCALIWCSDMDFALHAYRMRAEYFMTMPVTAERLREGLSIWRKREDAFRRKERLRT